MITEHNVREGQFVTPADNMFTIVDLSEVWVMIDVFEHQLAWVRPGLSTEITHTGLPGSRLGGPGRVRLPGGAPAGAHLARPARVQATRMSC